MSGRRDSNIKQWDVITIGNLSRNRQWSESDAKGIRAAICTCALITGKGSRILIVPSMADIIVPGHDNHFLADCVV
jgi:hypothetical protein